FRRQVELGAESFLHSRADLFGTMKFKEKMPGIQSSKERASDPPGDKHQDESRNEFPLQRAAHCKNSSWIAESAMANPFAKDSTKGCRSYSPPRNARVIPPATNTRMNPAMSFHCNVRFISKTHPGSPNPRWRTRSQKIHRFRGFDLLHGGPRLWR